MHRLSLITALCLATNLAHSQGRPLNVERRPYDYELIEFISLEGLTGADRQLISGFLAERQAARDAFEKYAESECPEFLGGDVSVGDFAAHLDQGVDTMNREIEMAFRTLRNRLSASGLSTVENEFSRSPLWSADSRAVDIAEVLPGTAEASFRRLCVGERNTQPPPEVPQRQ